MSEIIECEVCHHTLVTNETNVYKDIPCPHCNGIASPKLIWEKEE